MDYMGYMSGSNPISRIDNLVNNFDKMNFKRNMPIRKAWQANRIYTDFSVSKILQLEYRGNNREQYECDSDGTHSVDCSEHYFSDDEDSHLHGNKSCLSTSPNYIHHFGTSTYEQHSRQPIQVTRRNHIREGEGFSSDSSDMEAPLDLRISRKKTPPKMVDELPAWVFCTRYSDRPTAGPRVRKPRQKSAIPRKRNRTAFNSSQIDQLTLAFDQDPYLSESRRAFLAGELGLHETSVKIWFQNQRAKVKKDRTFHPLADRLAQDGLYNHKLAVSI